MDASTGVVTAVSEDQRRRGGMISEPMGMDVSPDGQHVAYTSNNTLFLARIPSGDKERELSIGSAGGANLFFSPDGARLAVCYMGGLEVHALPDLAKMKSVVPPPRRTMFAAAFSPDGLTFATTGSPPIYLWDARTWAIRDSLIGHSTIVRSIVFDRRGELIASSGVKTLIVWDRQAARPLWKRDFSHQIYGHGLDFSPDGHWLATGSVRGGVIILDARTGETAREWIAHDENGVGAIAFSPDGHRLVTSGFKEGIRVWDFDRLMRGARH